MEAVRRFPIWFPPTITVDYKIQLIDTLCKLGPGFIAVEEPESFIGAEYSEGFQEESLDYYGTEFVDPASSAERYMSSKLMTHLSMTMIDSIGEYMNEHYPDIDLVVATHSTANYTHWNIVGGRMLFLQRVCRRHHRPDLERHGQQCRDVWRYQPGAFV